MTGQLLYLSRADVEQVALDFPTILRLLEGAFREKGSGQVEMPPKPGIHPDTDAFIHAMPAYIPKQRSAGIKWVSGFPKNKSRGLPYISGLIILNDVKTGFPYCVMDCTWVTACRTAGATALSARYLARPESATVGIIACGVQGRTNLEALTNIFPIRRAYAYDIDPNAQKHFVEEMTDRLDIEIIAVRMPEGAVRESDLVVTSGPIFKQPRATIEAGWLQPGAFASAVDFDSYWKPAALAQIDKLSTDDIDQFNYYRRVGYFKTTPQPYADLGEIVVGEKPGRENDSERTMAINLGLALDDIAVAPEIYRRAKKLEIGTWLPL
ncbi:MAG: ornithine cyclodeaminase family protein [Chloroflexota bacterium]|nr:ornithine cyclodeaminase family protein [Chloroflexota bacterium]